MLGMEKRFGMGPLFPSLSAVLPVFFFAVFPVTRETPENQAHPKERRKP